MPPTPKASAGRSAWRFAAATCISSHCCWNTARHCPKTSTCPQPRWVSAVASRNAAAATWVRRQACANAVGTWTVESRQFARSNSTTRSGIPISQPLNSPRPNCAPTCSRTTTSLSPDSTSAAFATERRRGTRLGTYPLKCSHNRQRAPIDHLTQHKAGVHAGDALNPRDLVEQQVLIGIHVADNHLQLVIGLLAGDEQAFQHLRNIIDRRLQVGETLRRMLVHRDTDQCHQAQAEFFRIEQRPVAGDQPALLQRPDPTQAG